MVDGVVIFCVALIAFSLGFSCRGYTERRDRAVAACVETCKPAKAVFSDGVCGCVPVEAK